MGEPELSLLDLRDFVGAQRSANGNPQTLGEKRQQKNAGKYLRNADGKAENDCIRLEASGANVLVHSSVSCNTGPPCANQKAELQGRDVSAVLKCVATQGGL